jgi:hypothetical protein
MGPCFRRDDTEGRTAFSRHSEERVTTGKRGPDQNPHVAARMRAAPAISDFPNFLLTAG